MRTALVVVALLSISVGGEAFARERHEDGRGFRDNGPRDDAGDRGGNGWGRHRQHQERVRQGWVPHARRDVVIGIPPSRHHVWVQSAFVPRDGFYVQVPGHWARRPHPRANWVEGHWEMGPVGWVWVDGCWR